MTTDSSPSQVNVRIDQRSHSARVAYVSLNNARKINTLNSPLMRELVEKLKALGSDPELRAIVLTGEGSSAFIGGANIYEMLDFDIASARAYITLVHECCAAVRAVPVPVIARINGYAIGAGLEIAASCDLRAASVNAKFAMPEVKLGVPSVVEAALIPSLVGWGRAREILLLGETFGAEDAAAWGLVERVVADADLDACVEKWVSSILHAEPRAVRMQKQLMRSWEDLPLRAAIRTGIDCFAEAWEQDAPKSAMRKFVAAENERKAARKKPA